MKSSLKKIKQRQPKMHLNKINQMNYAAVIKQKSFADVLKIGIAFSGKRFKMFHERLKSEFSIQEPHASYGINPKDVIANGIDTGNFTALLFEKERLRQAIENAKILESDNASARKNELQKRC